jgi:UDP-N-acetyl-D-glucosamine dehydrogenase
MDALNSHHKSLAGSTVLMLGVAYKANIDDMRESPAIKITELLLAKGAKVVYHDPHVPEYRAGGVSMSNAALTPA